EAADRLVVFVVVSGGLAGGVGGSLGRGDGVVAGGWVFVGVGQWCPGSAQVPDEVGGEHADQDVGFDAVLQAVVDGAQVEVVDLDGAEVAFHMGEVLVGGDGVGGLELVGGDAGADDVDAVEGRFGVDAGLAAGDGQGGVGDGHVEVFGHLVLVDDFADA